MENIQLSSKDKQYMNSPLLSFSINNEFERGEFESPVIKLDSTQSSIHYLVNNEDSRDDRVDRSSRIENKIEKTTDEKIEFYSSSMSTLLKLNISFTKEQLEVANRIIKHLTDTYLGELHILKTDEDEVQFLITNNKDYTSLIVDEYGGLGLLVTNRNKINNICEYVDYEEIDKKTIFIYSKHFMSISMSA